MERTSTLAKACSISAWRLPFFPELATSRSSTHASSRSEACRDDTLFGLAMVDQNAGGAVIRQREKRLLVLSNRVVRSSNDVVLDSSTPG